MKKKVFLLAMALSVLSSASCFAGFFDPSLVCTNQVDDKNIRPGGNIVPLAWGAVLNGPGLDNIEKSSLFPDEREGVGFRKALYTKHRDSLANQRPTDKHSVYYEFYYDMSRNHYIVRGHALAAQKRVVYYAVLRPDSKLGVIATANPDEVRLLVNMTPINPLKLNRRPNIDEMPALQNEDRLNKYGEAAAVSKYGSPSHYRYSLMYLDDTVRAELTDIAGNVTSDHVNCIAVEQERSLLKRSGIISETTDQKRCFVLDERVKRLVVKMFDPETIVSAKSNQLASGMEYYKKYLLEYQPQQAVLRDPSLSLCEFMYKIDSFVNSEKGKIYFDQREKTMAEDTVVEWVRNPTDNFLYRREGRATIKAIVSMMDNIAADTKTSEMTKDFDPSDRELGSYPDPIDKNKIQIPLSVVDLASSSVFDGLSLRSHGITTTSEGVHKTIFVNPANFMYRVTNTGRNVGRCKTVKFELFLNGLQKATGEKTVCTD